MSSSLLIPPLSTTVTQVHSVMSKPISVVQHSDAGQTRVDSLSKWVNTHQPPPPPVLNAGWTIPTFGDYAFLLRMET